MPEFVRLEVADGVGTIRLDRPKMNAISFAVQDELRAAAAEATERADVKAVVVWGGARIFAAGNDVPEMADLAYPQMVDRSGPLQGAVTAVARIPKPVVAAVNGYALGGGCELALAADIRIAAEDATFGQPEILLGIIPGAGGTQRLSRLVGPSRAKDLIYTGRFVKADEALAIGLVDRVVPADQVYAEAVSVLTQLADVPVVEVCGLEDDGSGSGTAPSVLNEAVKQAARAVVAIIDGDLVAPLLAFVDVAIGLHLEVGIAGRRQHHRDFLFVRRGDRDAPRNGRNCRQREDGTPD